jgi:hypothetical protein
MGTPQKGVEIIKKRSTAPGRDSLKAHFRHAIVKLLPVFSAPPKENLFE